MLVDIDGIRLPGEIVTLDEFLAARIVVGNDPIDTMHSALAPALPSSPRRNPNNEQRID